jgi:hypothetical protein
MRGGEVFGGYGYADREEYALPRGELVQQASPRTRHDDEQRGGHDGSRG